MTNLKEERMLILEMIREGKISTDEATKLLKSIGNARDTSERADIDNTEFEEKLDKFYDNVNTFTKDIKEKVGSAYETSKPVVKDHAQKVLTKTAQMLDHLSKKLTEDEELESDDENTDEFDNREE